ncbi:AAA family ATPase [Candidatus Poriferisodalis sp.]|uniref:AAA family ATPase n=1 Tax=Candidatus Poriferisodalis sp. TaxID=3101277 RepID=UPI003B5B4D79
MQQQVGGLSALLSFTAANARSYRDEVRINLLASQFAEDGVVRELDIAGHTRSVKVLPAAGIFGANASGKTTLLRVMNDMRSAVLHSFGSHGPGAAIAWRPFRLDASSACRPTRLEVDLIIDGIRWQYGMEVNETVNHEYAYSFPKGRQALLFQRDESSIDYGPSMRAMRDVLGAFVRPQTLVLSTVGGFDDRDIHPLSPLYRWFEHNLAFVGADSRDIRLLRLAQLFEDTGRRGRATALVRAADLGITEVEIVETELDGEAHDQVRALMEVMLGSDNPLTATEDFPPMRRVRLRHCGRDDEVSLELEDESQGTVVWLGLSAAVLDALAGGHVLLVDELDASLHPDLVRRIVELFQAPHHNPRMAQLVFNAHEVELLGDTEQRDIGRDQLWLTQKDDDGATTVSQAIDYRPRKDVSLRRSYLQGRYGGVPDLDAAAFEQASAEAIS